MLALPYSMAVLGWVGGPIMIIIFAVITLYTSVVRGLPPPPPHAEQHADLAHICAAPLATEVALHSTAQHSASTFPLLPRTPTP